ncbi:sodium/potassium/calcium exchanger Nckx30C-like isoform X9 [Portunus trituberculatus]|uniref:sodium/potassium/calcium exchanger Nckx30C-like isoform X9 n=1 Tax=Portunus trituberculatus TaxID=210409 RepID=UPI001E1CD1A7|nr:sodium/potassium/calcium exchanger Nckx30C-like isoform X9 [Portunus trituberculatus]XP_045112187.1 sodium/potassium/calcium exchanger Nckx30C-like isoform X9 [Portunus trituberculatus]
MTAIPRNAPLRRRRRWHGLLQLGGVTVFTFGFVGAAILLQGAPSPPYASRHLSPRNIRLSAGSRSLLQATSTEQSEVPETSVEPANESVAGPPDDPLFPPDLFTLEERRKGAILLHVLGMIYMFVALAIVCDEFFVPALDVIIEKLQISEDVAGATFMAAGGSAPELFTSVIGVFISFDDVGIGTIVGSAVFNILFVIGMCVLFSKTVLDLTWWPLFRDVTFYSIALLMLVVCFLDNNVYWYEALVMFLLYIAYCLFMKFNADVERFVKKHLNRNKVTRVCSTDQLVPNHAAGPQPAQQGGRRASAAVLHPGTKFRHGLLQLMIHTIDPLHDGKVDEKATQLHAIASLKVLLDATKPQNGRVETYRTDGLAPDPRPDNQSHVSGRSSQGTEMTHVDSLASSDAASHSGPHTNGDLQSEGNSVANNGDPDEEEDSKPIDLSWPSTWRKRITYIVVAPLIIPLWITLPDTRTPRGKQFFFVTFVGSILWIAAFSYLMVWWASLVGEAINIPPEVMGLTILAAGTSVPDLITSVIVARKGFGDMAVSSSVGSNLFDVTCGLPIPWLLFALGEVIKNLLNGRDPGDINPIEVKSDGMACSIMLLFGMLMFVIVAIACSKWKMNKGLGMTMFVLYFIFVMVSLFFEYDIIFCFI